MRSLFSRLGRELMASEEKLVKTTETIEKVLIEKETVIETPDIHEKESVDYVFLLNSFFEQKFSDPDQILDKLKSKNDREARAYVLLRIFFEGNTYLVPLKKDISGNPPQWADKISYPVPNTKKTNAGLDFRKMLIVNDESFYRIDEARISSSQKKIIQDNFEEIKGRAIAYIKDFKKAAARDRNKKTPLYKLSALNNFLDELGIK